MRVDVNGTTLYTGCKGCYFSTVTIPHCDEARRLLDSYAAALVVYHDAREPFLNRRPAGDSDSHDSQPTKDQAFRKLAAARREYWAHLDWHGCRQTSDAMAQLSMAAGK